MKIYISGKITGLPMDEVRKKFEQAEEDLKAAGHIPVSPVRLCDNPGLDYEDFMHIDYAMIDVCDAVALLPDWTYSSGAKREQLYASMVKHKPTEPIGRFTTKQKERSKNA